MYMSVMVLQARTTENKHLTVNWEITSAVCNNERVTMEEVTTGMVNIVI